MKSLVRSYGGTLGHNAQPTSVEAAVKMFPRAGTDARKVLDVIVSRGGVGATDDEIEIELGMIHQTASARRRGLVLEDWVKSSGAKRKTRSGSSAIVWVIKREKS